MSTPAARTPLGADSPIPIVDLAPLLAGEDSALEVTAAAIRAALETIGFYVIVNHGVPRFAHRSDFRASRAISCATPRGQDVVAHERA